MIAKDYPICLHKKSVCRQIKLYIDQTIITVFSLIDFTVGCSQFLCILTDSFGDICLFFKFKWANLELIKF